MVLRDYANGTLPQGAVEGGRGARRGGRLRASRRSTSSRTSSSRSASPTTCSPLALTWGLVKRELRDVLRVEGAQPRALRAVTAASAAPRISRARARAPRAAPPSALRRARHGRPWPGSTHSKRSAASRSIERGLRVPVPPADRARRAEPARRVAPQVVAGEEVGLADEERRRAGRVAGHRDGEEAVARAAPGASPSSRTLDVAGRRGRRRARAAPARSRAPRASARDRRRRRGG